MPKQTVHKSVIIRPATQADLAAMQQIEQAANFIPWSMSNMRDCLRNYNCRLLVIENIIVGFVVFMLHTDECTILNVSIIPEQQHQGYGTKLLEAALAEAQQLGATTVFLEVRESNNAAISLYTKQGFNEVGIRKNYYPTPTGRENAIIFAKQL